MSVNEEFPLAISLATGTTTYFPHAFTLLDDGDLVVQGTAAGATTTYQLGVDYTVSGIGSPTGAVTFLVAPPANMLVTRYRDTALARYVDYQDHGDLQAPTLNADFARIWYALQDIVAGGKSLPNTVRVPVGETIVPLPNAANRALRFLYFDAAGNVTAVAAGTPTPYSVTPYNYFATNGQTTFAATYTPGMIQVFRNGAKLAVTDYIATDGLTVTLLDPAALNDPVDIWVFGTFVAGIPDWTQLGDAYNAALGDALVAVKRSEAGAVATTQHIINQRRAVFPTADYAAAADGVADDADELNAALACGAKVIDGSGLVYKTASAVIVPAGVSFENFTIQMADADYIGIVLSDNCAVKGSVIGTSRTTGANGQVGIKGISKTGIDLDVRVSNTNTGVYLETCTHCDVTARVESISGQSGQSEGYGVLMTLGSNNNKVRVWSKWAKRHALYLSAGSSFNDCICHSDGTQTSYAVQINSYRSQAICEGNVIAGSDYGSAGGVVFAMSDSAADAGGAIINNTCRDFVVTGLSAASGSYVANLYPAFLGSISYAGTTSLPSGNTFINCKARGTFNSTTLGVVQVSGAAEDFTLRDIDIRAVCLNAATGAFVIDSTTGVTRMRGINIDLGASGAGIIGSYFNVASPNFFSLDDVQIACANATKVYYSGSTGAQRIGDGNSFVSNVAVTAVGATASKTATITVPVHLQTAYMVQALVTSESVTAVATTNVKVTSKSATQFVLSVYNGHAAPQDITIDYRITGLPA